MDPKFTSNTFFICYKVLATAVMLREEITDRGTVTYTVLFVKPKQDEPLWRQMCMVR
jgi:hypothetical protein